MLKKLLLLCVIAAAALPAFAKPNKTVLLDRTYNVRMQAGSVQCYEGLPPNGHNYPVYTMLVFSLPNYNLWLDNVWTNVDQYTAEVGYRPCSDFAKILRAPADQDLIGLVSQKITDSYLKNGVQKCMRFTREDAALLVDGVKFTAVNEFHIGPLNDALCKE